ncbi:MAG TPA: hypothetical protein VMF88_13860 [Bacteroidota bacterium]|nr:hypothetical protein [Bacteroidota bacterium]
MRYISATGDFPPSGTTVQPGGAVILSLWEGLCAGGRWTAATRGEEQDERTTAQTPALKQKNHRAEAIAADNSGRITRLPVCIYLPG